MPILKISNMKDSLLEEEVEVMKELIELFFTFFKIGASTFGGGYAMLPILQKELVDKKKWITNEEITDYYAIGQCTPGIISVNTATFIGYKQKGIMGGIVATLGIIFPSILIILLIANFIETYKNLAFVQNAFNGIRVCVGALIISAVFKLWKSSITDKLTLGIFILIFLLSLLLDLSPILLLILAGLLGLFKKGEENA